MYHSDTVKSCLIIPHYINMRTVHTLMHAEQRNYYLKERGEREPDLNAQFLVVPIFGSRVITGFAGVQSSPRKKRVTLKFLPSGLFFAKTS